jgi:two-component system, LytTR family, response regulator
MRSTEAIELSRKLSALLATTTGERPSGATTPDPARRLVVPTATGDLVLDVDEIDWIEADDYYAAVHTRGRRHLIRESLSSLETRLDPARFVRIHRSAIVHLERVREFRNDQSGSEVVLRDGTRIAVSRRRREQVASLLRRYIG